MGLRSIQNSTYDALSLAARDLEYPNELIQVVTRLLRNCNVFPEIGAILKTGTTLAYLNSLHVDGVSPVIWHDCVDPWGAVDNPQHPNAPELWLDVTRRRPEPLDLVPAPSKAVHSRPEVLTVEDEVVPLPDPVHEDLLSLWEAERHKRPGVDGFCFERGPGNDHLVPMDYCLNVNHRWASYYDVHEQSLARPFLYRDWVEELETRRRRFGTGALGKDEISYRYQPPEMLRSKGMLRNSTALRLQDEVKRRGMEAEYQYQIDAIVPWPIQVKGWHDIDVI